MFNKSSFCHIASNNRNDQKGSVFIYKTTDTLAQVTQSGYFNEKLIDINVHDLIIHVQYDPVARTLKKSVLIVTERTLDNVETTPILDQTVVGNIDQLGDQIDQLVGNIDQLGNQIDRLGNQVGNQIDQLGNQVAGIEKKIPKNASAQNQLATKNEIPTVPANISAFNNDRGYITSSALTPYATTSALTSGLALKVAIAQGAENAGKILKIDDSGNVIAADESGGASLPILYHTWSDHLLNDVSWLRADTFSWQSGDVYVAAYEHLAADYENAQTSTYYAWTGEGYISGTQETVYTTSQVPSVGDTVYSYGSDGLFLRFGTVATASSANITFTYVGDGATSSSMEYGGKTLLPVHLETIEGITIAYRLAQDGHKITKYDTDAVAIYEATGVAWYYILDTINKRFKLPRTKWGFTGLRDSVGGYVPQNVLLPNITGYATFSANGSSDYLMGITNTNGALYGSTDVSSSSGCGGGNNHSGAKRLRLDASRSSSVYSGNGTNTLIQPRGTQMYLYFYVGNFAQSAIKQTAGLNAEMFNDLNAHKVIEFQAPTASNGYIWYRKYADGWVEQGGRALVPATNTSSSSTVVITLPVPIQTPESAVLSYNGLNASENFANCENQASVTTTTVTIGRWNNSNSIARGRYYNWTLSGMSAQ